MVDPRSGELRWRTDKGQTVPGRIRIRATWDYQAGRGWSRCGITPRRGKERDAPANAQRWRDGQDSNLWPRLCRPLLFRLATTPYARHPPGGKRGKKENHFPARAGRVVGQAGGEPAFSDCRKRMGDHTPLSHIAGLSRRSWLLRCVFAAVRR